MMNRTREKKLGDARKNEWRRPRPNVVEDDPTKPFRVYKARDGKLFRVYRALSQLHVPPAKPVTFPDAPRTPQRDLPVTHPMPEKVKKNLLTAWTNVAKKVFTGKSESPD